MILLVRHTLAVIALSALATSGVRAQTNDPPPVLGTRDGIMAAGFAVGTVGAHAFDRRLAERLQRPATQSNGALHRTATIFRMVAQPGLIVALPALWAAGRLLDHPTAADVGLHGSEAIGAAVVGVNVVKVLAGRARPSVNVHDPSSFAFGRGLRGGEEYRSFPSGHTATAFAAASALTAEVISRRPGARWAAGVPLYGAATAVGWSRMYDNRHWASDVVGGAGFGTIAGLAVVRFNHARRNDRVDRWLLGVSLDPSRGLVPYVAPGRR